MEETRLCSERTNAGNVEAGIEAIWTAGKHLETLTKGMV